MSQKMIDIRNKMGAVVDVLYDKMSGLIKSVDEENICINRMKIDAFKTIVFGVLTYEPNAKNADFISEMVDIVPLIEVATTEESVDYLNQKVLIYLDYIQFLSDSENL